MCRIQLLLLSLVEAALQDCSDCCLRALFQWVPYDKVSKQQKRLCIKETKRDRLMA